MEICSKKDCPMYLKTADNNCDICTDVADCLEAMEFKAKQAALSSPFSDGLCLRRFTPVSCGCVESLMGRYLQRKDVIKAIEHILDDDELVFDRLYQLLNNLKA